MLYFTGKFDDEKKKIFFYYIWSVVGITPTTAYEAIPEIFLIKSIQKFFGAHFGNSIAMERYGLGGWLWSRFAELWMRYKAAK